MVRLTALATALVVVLAAFAGLGIWLLSGISLVPPTSLTLKRMQNLEHRLLVHARAHNALPATLNELDSDPNASKDALLDAFGTPIVYSVSSDLVVTLSSLGADHVEGGNGNNADRTLTFPAKQPNGDWSDPDSSASNAISRSASTQRAPAQTTTQGSPAP